MDLKIIIIIVSDKSKIISKGFTMLKIFWKLGQPYFKQKNIYLI